MKHSCFFCIDLFSLDHTYKRKIILKKDDNMARNTGDINQEIGMLRYKIFNKLLYDAAQKNQNIYISYKKPHLKYKLLKVNKGLRGELKFIVELNEEIKREFKKVYNIREFILDQTAKKYNDIINKIEEFNNNLNTITINYKLAIECIDSTIAKIQNVTAIEDIKIQISKPVQSLDVNIYTDSKLNFDDIKRLGGVWETLLEANSKCTNLDEFIILYVEYLISNTTTLSVPWVGTTRNYLFKGVPGTGKSRIIDKKLIQKFNIDESRRINIHSASNNTDLMQGIGVEIDTNKQMTYIEKKGIILELIYLAILNPEKNFAIILEEIQENSLNELIGDLIYLIEDEKRVDCAKIKDYYQNSDLKELIVDTDELNSVEKYKEQLNDIIDSFIDQYIKEIHFVTLPNLTGEDKVKKIILPNNIYFICTTNYREDKKIIEDNLFRRFEVIDIYPQASVINNPDVAQLFEQLNKAIEKQLISETHVDRYLQGHSNWINVNKVNQLCKCIIKFINEFKEIKDMEFDSFKGILKILTDDYKDEIDKEKIDINKKDLERLIKNNGEKIIDTKQILYLMMLIKNLIEEDTSTYYSIIKIFQELIGYDFL